MNVVYKGMAAGLIATLVLSILMIVQSAAGLLPEANVIPMLGTIANNSMGLPAGAVTGWAFHLVIGIVIGGGVFAAAYAYFPGPNAVVRGLVYAVIVWLVMLLLILPIGGLGFFGLEAGGALPFVLLVLHLIFGAVLGLSYQKMTTPEERASLSVAAQDTGPAGTGSERGGD